MPVLPSLAAGLAAHLVVSGIAAATALRRPRHPSSLTAHPGAAQVAGRSCKYCKRHRHNRVWKAVGRAVDHVSTQVESGVRSDGAPYDEAECEPWMAFDDMTGVIAAVMALTY